MYYYIHWTRLLCTGIIPFSYLSYMNLRIYTRIRQTSLSTVRSRSSSSKKASNLAAVLIVIGESCSSHKVGGTFYLIRYKKSIFSMAKIRKIVRKKVQILLRNNHFEHLYSIGFSPDSNITRKVYIIIGTENIDKRFYNLYLTNQSWNFLCFIFLIIQLLDVLFKTQLYWTLGNIEHLRVYRLYNGHIQGFYTFV